MIRKVTWRSRPALAASLAAYGVLGWFWSGNGTAEAWLYRIGLTAAAVAPLIFVAVYSALARWWASGIGTVVVLLSLSIVPTMAPLAYVFWADGGMLTQSWLAWLAVSGPMLSALILGCACFVWLRTSRDGGTGMEGGGGDDGSPG